MHFLILFVSSLPLAFLLPKSLAFSHIPATGAKLSWNSLTQQIQSQKKSFNHESPLVPLDYKLPVRSPIAPTPITTSSQRDSTDFSFQPSKAIATLFIALTMVCTAIVTTPPSAMAYGAYTPTDVTSTNTVQAAVTAIQQAVGDAEATAKAFESVAEIILEGKGVGGQINYQGIVLDRGYVADEDTTLYNPGLSLLTESEKERLVEAVVQSKLQFASTPSTNNSNSWSADCQAGYDFLRSRLDPLHMRELRGYLQFVPVWGAVWYLIVLAIQQSARELFPAAYAAGVVAIFAPAIVLIALGP